MARETRKERQAREAQERAKHQAELQKTWPQRLLNLACEYANLPGFSVQRDGDLYKFTPSEEVMGYDTVFRLPFSFAEFPEIIDAEYRMDEAEWAVKKYHEKVAEELRQQEVKKAALAKLTEEERELLGLKKW